MKKIENNIDPYAFTACEFAVWLQENRWFSYIDGKWNYSFQHGTAISKKSYDKNYKKTTLELYHIFRKDMNF